MAPSVLKIAPGNVKVGLHYFSDHSASRQANRCSHTCCFTFPLGAWGPFPCCFGLLPCVSQPPKAKCPSKTDGLDGHCWHELFPIKVGYVYLSICPGRRRVFLRTWLSRHRSSMLTPRLAAMVESVSPLATLWYNFSPVCIACSVS